MIENNKNTLIIKEEEGDMIDITLSPERYPICFNRKVIEFMDANGLSREEAENIIANSPIQLELLYSIDQGLFAIESEPLAYIPAYNPYTGNEIPNENLPTPEDNPLKTLDTTICQLTDLPTVLRTEVYDKHDFSIEHMGKLEEAMELIEGAVSALNDIDLTEERERTNS
ncbi:hypothetical protein [Bacteroides sp. 51]|uniref:hypothetical protein n=1 Tax=Bacteroides sp. 51 TaxID=2302938 RepID=UPI0013D10D3B|nr:hypothetical protein [Bacteroides sp. 51]NDV80773.1 hypothetical protein [Bacteroides sp. 51]